MNKKFLNRRILLAVPESDAHVVGNKILELHLKSLGFDVTNLGACTPSNEIAIAAKQIKPICIIISSHNGYALYDLKNLNDELLSLGIDNIKIFIGGNLTVGPFKDEKFIKRKFGEIGIVVLDSLKELEKEIFNIVSIAKVSNIKNV